MFLNYHLDIYAEKDFYTQLNLSMVVRKLFHQKYRCLTFDAVYS